MSALSPIRVLLVDDHAVVRGGFARLLEYESDIEVVGEAADAQGAYKRHVEKAPDVTVMDLTLPGKSGFEACRRILARDAAARILVFSVHETGTYLRRVIELGILGYISKRSASSTMIDAVRAVAGGERYIGPELQRFLDYDGVRDEAAALETLTDREFEVFCQLARGESVDAVAELLNISPKTAGNHCTSLKRKLGARNAAELTLMALRAGLLAD